MDAAPKYELITGELLEAIKGDCQDVVEFVAKQYQVSLGFDDQSIVWLSSFVEEQRGGMSPETRHSWSVRIGIYLGFAIIERYGGEWVFTTEGNEPAVRFSTGAMAFPVTKACKQFENGSVDNIYGLYRNIGRLLRREFEPGAGTNAG